jgi:NADPH2:quinone reductase
MKAIILEAYNTAFKVVTTNKPIPAKGQVLVHVKASGVNPLDLKIKAGQAGHAQQPLHKIPGIDMAGIVEAVGEGVSKLSPGDEVYGMIGGIGGNHGSLAEYVAADADLLAIKPKNFDMREAAALPLIFITAWEALVDKAHVKSGQKVLIHGGAGGVGHIAVQIALASGAKVFTTDSPLKHDYIRTQYVDEHTNGEGFDVILDTVGGETLDKSFQAAKVYDGHVVSILGWGTHALAPLSFRAATYSGVFTLLPLLTGKGRAHHGEILEAASKMAEEGKLTPLVDPRRFFLDSVEEAYEALKNKTAKGKVVIEIPDNDL